MCVVSKSIEAIKMILGDCNLNAISRNLASEHPLLIWRVVCSARSHRNSDSARGERRGVVVCHARATMRARAATIFARPTVVTRRTGAVEPRAVGPPLSAARAWA